MAGLCLTGRLTGRCRSVSFLYVVCWTTFAVPASIMPALIWPAKEGAALHRTSLSRSALRSRIRIRPRFPFPNRDDNVRTICRASGWFSVVPVRKTGTAGGRGLVASGGRKSRGILEGAFGMEDIGTRSVGDVDLPSSRGKGGSWDSRREE